MTTARFAATLSGSAGSATGIVVPPAVIDQLGHGKRPPVRVTINSHTYRTTVGLMGGNHMIPVSAAVRKAAGLAAGDKIHVELVLDTTPREVDMPPDFASALDASPAASSYFTTLSNSVQRYHVDNINAAKTADAAQWRLRRYRPGSCRVVRRALAPSKRAG